MEREVPSETSTGSAVNSAHSGKSGSDTLVGEVYDQLRALAQHHMSREPSGNTLTATALVHEAYLKLRRGDPKRWGSREHFYAAAALAMRRILIDRARGNSRAKRGGGFDRISLGEVAIVTDTRSDELLAIDEALTDLERKDPRKCEVVNLRYFAGLTVEETARTLGISPRLVNSEWAFAKAWLRRALADEEIQDGLG